MTKTTAEEKIFMVKAKLTYKINLPTPMDPEDAIYFRARKTKFSDYLMEIREVENIIDDLEVEEEQVISLKEDLFYKKIASAEDYSMLFDGDYIKLCELNTRSNKYSTSWVLWCKSVSLIH